jgi:hypothetical protein
VGEIDNSPSPVNLDGLAIEQLGQLDACEASKALLRAEFGLTDEGLRGYTKSGVFAAYAAHGLGIMTSDPRIAPEEPIASLTRPSELLDLAPYEANILRSRSIRLRQWYIDNADWSVAAQALRPIFVKDDSSISAGTLI